MILLLQHRDDSINSYSKYLSEKEIPFVNVRLSELVDRVKISDRFNDNYSKACWRIDGKMIDIDNITGVYQKFSGLEQSLFSEFIEEDRDYARSEYYAYLMYRLSHFANVVNPLKSDKLSVSFQQLPHAYAMAEKVGLLCPDYYASSCREELVEYARSQPTILTENLYAYNEIEPSKFMPNNAILGTRYHFGAPVIVHIVGDKIMATAYYSEGRKTFALSDDMAEKCHAVCRSMGLVMAEIYFQRTLENEFYFYYISGAPRWELNALDQSIIWSHLTARLNKINEPGLL